MRLGSTLWFSPQWGFASPIIGIPRIKALKGHMTWLNFICFWVLVIDSCTFYTFLNTQLKKKLNVTSWAN